MSFTLGCDPEVFLQDFSGNVVSAIGKIGGTKRKPRVIEALSGGNLLIQHGDFALQEDNVTLEYNTPLAYHPKDWRSHLLRINKYIDEELAAKGLKKLIVPSVVMPEKELQDPRAWVFGCEPDYNAWEMKINPRPDSPDKFLRSAGGHIHVGYTGANKITSIEIIRLLDMFIGVPLVLAEEPNRRAELYGKAGACRFKKYGVEYRTPSNFWTANEKRVSWVYDQVNKVMNMLPQAASIVDKRAREVIDSGDKVSAMDFMAEEGIAKCPM